MASEAKGLGRLPATDDKHLRRWSLTPDTIPTKPTPFVAGIDWFDRFNASRLVRRGHSYYLPSLDQPWGEVEGGHAICMTFQALIPDTIGWYRRYDQKLTPRCVGYAIARMMSLLNRYSYDPDWIYAEAQLRFDEWPGTNYEGTSVRAGCDVAREVGMVRVKRIGGMSNPSLAHGIVANRWARNVEDLLLCLAGGDAVDASSIRSRGYVEALQSWGEDYPHIVRVPLETLDMLVFRRSGEATVVTDR